MDGWLVLRGILIGLSIAAPVGPIGVLVIRRTLAEGRAMGLATGMGAATADAIYGIIGAFGLTLLTSALTESQFWLRIIGGAYMLYLGYRTFTALPATQAAPMAGGSLFGAYGSALALTLTNPATIFFFTLIFGGMGLGAHSGNTTGAALVAFGIVLGSALWWVILSSAVSTLRSRVTPTMLRWVNRVAGVVIAGFGVWALF